MSTVFQDQQNRRRNVIIGLLVLVVAIALLLFLNFTKIMPQQNADDQLSSQTQLLKLQQEAANKENLRDLQGAKDAYTKVKEVAIDQNNENAKLDAEAKIKQIQQEQITEQQQLNENKTLQEQNANEAGAQQLSD